MLLPCAPMATMAGEADVIHPTTLPRYVQTAEFLRQEEAVAGIQVAQTAHLQAAAME